MAEKARQQRRWKRHAPRHAVRVAVESEGLATASGEALDLSDGGACLALRTGDLGVGDEVILRLAFAGPAYAGPRRPLPATARVVWVGGAWGRPRYGVEWTHVGPQRTWIGWLTGV